MLFLLKRAEVKSKIFIVNDFPLYFPGCCRFQRSYVSSNCINKSAFGLSPVVTALGSTAIALGNGNQQLSRGISSAMNPHGFTNRINPQLNSKKGLSNDFGASMDKLCKIFYCES